VTAGANRREQIMPPRKANGVNDVRHAATARDKSGTPVEHSIENHSRLFIVRLAGFEQPAEHAHAELFDLTFVNKGRAPGYRCDLHSATSSIDRFA
jgi:hypothetical protein